MHTRQIQSETVHQVVGAPVDTVGDGLGARQFRVDLQQASQRRHIVVKKGTMPQHHSVGVSETVYLGGESQAPLAQGGDEIVVALGEGDVEGRA